MNNYARIDILLNFIVLSIIYLSFGFGAMLYMGIVSIFCEEENACGFY